MSNTLSVRVASRKTNAGEYYEGTVSIVGLKPTKLARRSDGSTMFPTKSAVSGAARNLAKSLGFADVDVSDATVATKTKVASKVSKTTVSVNAAGVANAWQPSNTNTQKKAAKKSSTSTTSTKKTN